MNKELAHVAMARAEGDRTGRPMTTFTPEERSPEGQRRSEALHALWRRGVAVPPEAFRDADKETPGNIVRGWDRYAEFWPEPGRRSGLSDHALAQAQANWQASSRFVAGQRAAQADVDAARAATAAEVDAATEQREAEYVAAMAERERLADVPRVLSPARMWD